MSDNNTPVVATKRISYGPEANEHILPGTVFAPADHGIDADELHALDAVSEATDADIALHAQQVAATEAAAAEAEKAKAEADAAVADAAKSAAKPAKAPAPAAAADADIG